MFLGVTTGGWVLLGVVYLPLVILALVFLGGRSKGPTSRKIVILGVAALIFFALPVVDAAVSEWRMRQLCPKAGLKVNQRVVVDGYFDESLQASFLTGTGYRFREYFDPAKARFVRAELTPDGRVVLLEIDKPTARYHYKKRVFSYEGNGVERSEQRIVDTVTGENVAVQVSIGRLPGFVDRLWLRWFGPLEHLETCQKAGAPELVTEAKRILIPANR
jgi:hypothetical protein